MSKNTNVTDGEMVAGVGLGILGFIALIFALPILLPLLGAFSGWVLSLTPVSMWIATGATALGLTGVTATNLPYVGAALGFLSLGVRSISRPSK